MVLPTDEELADGLLDDEMLVFCTFTEVSVLVLLG